MIKIKPIQLGLPARTANQLMVRPIILSTQETECNTYYEVIANNISEVVTQDEEGKETVTMAGESVVVASGNCPISEEQYSIWGEDNAYLEDIVLNFLGLERE